jgi:cytochrome c553
MSEADGFTRLGARLALSVGNRRPLWIAFAAAAALAGLAATPVAYAAAPGAAAAPIAAAPVQEPATAMAAAACAACHGPDGRSTGAIPALDKLDAATMSAKLKGFKSGEIDSTVMNRLTKAFSDAELDSLVKFMAAK